MTSFLWTWNFLWLIHWYLDWKATYWRNDCASRKVSWSGLSGFNNPPVHFSFSTLPINWCCCDGRSIIVSNSRNLCTVSWTNYSTTHSKSLGTFSGKLQSVFKRTHLENFFNYINNILQNNKVIKKEEMMNQLCQRKPYNKKNVAVE